MAKKSKRPTKPSEYRAKWQGTLETTPSGLTVKMRHLDPLEYCLLFVDPEKVREYELKSFEEVEKATREKLSSLPPDELTFKVLNAVVEEPRIVQTPQNEDELGFDELKPIDKRALLAAALSHINLLGRSAELRKFRGLQPPQTADTGDSDNVSAEAQRPS